MFGLRDAFFHLHPRIMERGEDRRNEKGKETAPFHFVAVPKSDLKPEFVELKSAEKN